MPNLGNEKESSNVMNTKSTVRAYLIIIIALISCNGLSSSRKDAFKSLEGTKWVLDFEASNLHINNMVL